MKKGRFAERKLVMQIAGGDREACAQLVRDQYERIYRLLARLCGDAHWAEDLTQETFAACWCRIGSFQGRASLGTWLRRIAYHKFIDWQRKRTRQVPTMPNADAMYSLADDAEALPAKQFQTDETHREILAAMEQLPPAYHEVIVLHYLEGLSYREMAYLLNQPAGTVKCRTSQALKKIKEILER